MLAVGLSIDLPATLVSETREFVFSWRGVIRNKLLKTRKEIGHCYCD